MLSLASSRIELSVTWQTLAVGCAAQLKINLSKENILHVDIVCFRGGDFTRYDFEV